MNLMSKLSDPIAKLAYPDSTLGLPRLRQLLSEIIDFNNIPFIISIAGTNGKGSTAAAISAIYAKNSIKVATFTSPHILTVHERMRIDGVNVPSATLLHYIAQLSEVLDQKQLQLCYFEVCFVIACMWFSDNNCDVWIIEAGIGGLKDCTNILDCGLYILTEVAYDHCAILGDNLEAIATQKLGLLRPDAIFICGVNRNLECISSALSSHHSLLLQRDFSLYDSIWRGLGHQFAVDIPAGILEKNISLAIAAVISLRHLFALDTGSINAALQAMRLLGRQMQIDFADRRFYLDGAHNPSACQALAKRLDADNIAAATAVFACARTKDVSGCFEAVRSNVVAAFAYAVDDQMYSKTELVALFPGVKWHNNCKSDGLLSDVIAATDPGATIVVFGSFRLVAVMLSAMARAEAGQGSCLLAGG